MKPIIATCVLTSAVAGAPGCADSLVDTDTCLDAHIDCSVQALRRDKFPLPFPSTTVEIEGSRTLEPTWIRPSDAESVASSKLLTDRERRLYLASVSFQGTLRISRLDDDGNITDSTPIEPIAGADYKPKIVSEAFKMWSTDAEASFKVEWQRGCDADAPCETQYEQFIFSSDLAQPPARFSLIPVGDFVRDQQGDLYSTTQTQEPGMSPIVNKVEGNTGRVLWTQNDLLYGEDWRWASTVVLGAKHTAVLISDSGFSEHLVVELDEAGRANEIGLDQYYVRQGYFALLASVGRPVLVMETESGLNVLRIDRLDTPPEALVFRGGGYASTDLLAVAADPDGNVYAATRSGGIRGVNPTLCRAERRAGNCVVLPAYVNAAANEQLIFDDIVARNNGVVYIRSKNYLLRLDLPD